MEPQSTVFVTGGGGYVGAVLVPKLLAAGYRVRVLDLFLYGREVLAPVESHPNLEIIPGDLRDQKLLAAHLPGSDAVIHLACISNDPSFELDPELGKSINYDAFAPLVRIARDSGVRRFVYASSSSVYGIKEEENVSEDLPLEPLTDYSRFKALCEDILRGYQAPDFTTVTVRPATLCGYSPRMRFDLVVNILTNQAVNHGIITVLGGEQRRPNAHIQDIADLYVELLARTDAEVAGKVWNFGTENYRVSEIAEIVRGIVGAETVEIVHLPNDDRRSYHISSERIKRDLGIVPRHTVADAVGEIVAAFAAGRIPDPLSDIRYYNIKTMQALHLA